MKFLQMLLTVALLTGIAGIGCSHTNNLADYRYDGHRALYRAVADEDAASGSVSVSSPGNNLFAGLATLAGSVVLGDQVRKKLERAVNRDSIVAALARGMEQATFDYLRLEPVASTADNPDYLVEVRLTEYQLISEESGLRARVSGTARIVQRGTGRLVWEDCATSTINLMSTPVSIHKANDVAGTATSAANAGWLLNMDDDEVGEIIESAARFVGEELGETLREDWAEMHGAD